MSDKSDVLQALLPLLHPVPRAWLTRLGHLEVSLFMPSGLMKYENIRTMSRYVANILNHGVKDLEFYSAARVDFTAPVNGYYMNTHARLALAGRREPELGDLFRLPQIRDLVFNWNFDRHTLRMTQYAAPLFNSATTMPGSSGTLFAPVEYFVDLPEEGVSPSLPAPLLASQCVADSPVLFFYALAPYCQGDQVFTESSPPIRVFRYSQMARDFNSTHWISRLERHVSTRSPGRRSYTLVVLPVSPVTFRLLSRLSRSICENTIVMDYAARQAKSGTPQWVSLLPTNMKWAPLSWRLHPVEANISIFRGVNPAEGYGPIERHPNDF